MSMKKICVLTLGCPKNIVDSEKIISILSNNFIFTENPNDADVILLNTCGFIQSAINETLEYIYKLEKLKIIKPNIKIFVFGCAVTRLVNNGSNLAEQFQFIDKFVPLKNVNEIIDEINTTQSDQKINLENVIRTKNMTPKYYAYLKISDGCNRQCSFCTIPSIKGKYKSVAKKMLIKEAESLVNIGVKEIILIGQETSNYGKDIGSSLYELLLDLTNIKGLLWIRIMYSHPMSFDLRVLDLMQKHKNICRYIDIPLQHIDDRILRAMNRNVTTDFSKKLILEMRRKVTDIHIRSTFITGFPSETTKEHNGLLDFLSEMKLERVGVFKYSRELDTAAFDLGKQVSEHTKQKRFDELMIMQQQISLENNRNLIGKSLKVLVEDDYDEKYFIGRSEFDAPEIDNCVYVEKNNRIKMGDIVMVEIFDAEEYGCFGR